MKHAWPSEQKDLVVEVCHIADGDLSHEQEPPFVYAAHGRICDGIVSDIENELMKNPPSKPGAYLYRASFFGGQYDGEGRIELPPGIELTEIGYKSMEEYVKEES